MGSDELLDDVADILEAVDREDASRAELLEAVREALDVIGVEEDEDEDEDEEDEDEPGPADAEEEKSEDGVHV